MILTSHFNKTHPIYGRMSKHPDAISIALSSPRWFKGRKYLALAPSGDLLDAFKNRRINDAQYTQIYQAQVLDRLDPRQVHADLGDETILLCWEASGKFCHRHLVAAWLKQAGFMIEEVRP